VRFWDSSAVVPLLLDESATAAAESLYRDDPRLLVWWATPVECASAVARRERDGVLPRAAADAARRRLRALAERWDEVLPADAIRSAAQRLLRLHPLHAADSVQLAAARAACRGNPEGFPFVCADQRLAAAAALEGFDVLGVVVK